MGRFLDHAQQRRYLQLHGHEPLHYNPQEHHDNLALSETSANTGYIAFGPPHESGIFAVVSRQTSSGGELAMSNRVDLASPAAPTGLQATPIETGISVIFNNIPRDEDGFVLQRSSDGGTNWTTIASNIAADVTEFFDDTVTAGANVVYQLAAFRTVGALTLHSAWTTTPVAVTSGAAKHRITPRISALQVTRDGAGDSTKVAILDTPGGAVNATASLLVDASTVPAGVTVTIDPPDAQGKRKVSVTAVSGPPAAPLGDHTIVIYVDGERSSAWGYVEIHIN